VLNLTAAGWNVISFHGMWCLDWSWHRIF